MNSRRILSLLLALLMMFSTFAELIPANVFASQTEDSTESTATTSSSIGSYEISMDEVTFAEDGSLIISLPDAAATETEADETEPVETEPVETEPVETEPVKTEPVETEPVETEPVETEPVETEFVETEPVETETEETEPEETEAEETPVLLTWFQWIGEKGVDASALTKEERDALSAEYGAYRINTLAEMGELPEGAAAGSVANNYIEIAVREDGHFTIGNRIGNPGYSSDDYQILLYGHPYGSTSETLITIDGAYENYFYADTISYSYNTATATMTIPEYNIKVEQTLKLVKSGGASFEDTVQIQYKVNNNDSKQHDVGIRIMMDTMLASNDYATFRVAAIGHITSARVFTGSSIPSMYQVYDNLDNPTTLATGYLYRGSDRKPDKVQFCNWGNIRGSGWNHNVSNGDYLGDSAVGIYFNPVTVKSGKSTTVRTYYGVSVGTGSGNSNEVTGDEVKLVIKDSYTKTPIEGVKVEYRCNLEPTVHTVYTDSSGIAILPDWNSGGAGGAFAASIPVSLKLSKEGYTSSTINTSYMAGSTVTYQLSPEDSATPVINSIILDTGTKNANLLTGTYTLDEDVYDHIAEKGSTGTITIKATADMENCTWLLVQDEKVLQKNSTGVFTLNIREEGEGDNKKTLVEGLSPDGYRYIQCISPSGEKSEKMRFGLKVRAGDKVEFFPLDLGEIMPDGSSPLAEGTLAALFLGNKFSFGLNKSSSLKFQVELVDGGGVRVGLNFSAKEWDDMNKKLDNGKTGKQMVEDLKDEMMDYMRSSKNKKYANKADQLVRFDVGNAKAELVFCGYGEGKLENGKVRIDLTAFVALKGDASYTTQFLVVSVPVYIQVGAEAEAKLQGSANLVNSEGIQFAFYDATFTPSVGVWLEGGAGVKGAVSVGAQGKGTISLICDLVNRSQRAEFVAKASLVAEAFVWEKEIPFAEKTFILYDSNDKEGTVYGGDENIFQMLEEMPFKLVTREEMTGENAEGGTSGGTAKVQLLNVGGTQYKFFLADRGGNQSNRFMLSYAKLENGVWTEDVPVMDDGTLDTYYDVATDGRNIYVVWSNSSKLFDDETVTVDEMFAAQEICFTTISADGTVAQPIRITDNGAMDILPAVTTVGETAYLAWYHTENGIENNTNIADHYLYHTSVTGNAAAEISTYSCGNAAISSISASAASGVPMATFVSNASDEYTFADNVTTVIDMSNGTLSTVDTTNKTIGKAVSGIVDGREQLFWMENGNVAYADSLTSEEPTYIFGESAIPGTISTDNYTVITASGSTYLIWTQSAADENEPTVAMTTVYSSGTWSDVHKLTDLSVGNISELDGYLNSEGQLVLVYTARNMTQNSDGGVDVSTASLEKVVEPEKSIYITDLEYEITDAVPGQPLPMTLSLVNTGNTAIDSLDLSINSQAGENYTTQLTGLNIGPGVSTSVDITDFVLSSSLTTRNTYEGQYVYTLTANATGSGVTAQETFEIGYDNVVLFKRDMALVDNRENIIIAVENQSGFPAANVHVRVLADAVDGVLIYDNVFEQIPANSQVTVYLDVEELNSTSLFASVSSDCNASEEVEYIELMIANPVTEATLTMETYGGGTVTPDEPIDVGVGESVYISAMPNDGYVFDGWYSHRDLVFLSGNEDSPEAEIQMPAGNTTVTACFASKTPYDFTLSSGSADIFAGEEFQLSAYFASEMETGMVIWTSSDESVAVVSGRGLVTGLAEGTAEITAACGEYVHTCQITVSYVDVTAIQMVYPKVNLEMGETDVLDVLTDPANGEASLVWTSSDESIAVVDGQGNVTAVGYGTAVITAAARTDSSVTAECTIHVIKAVEDISLSQLDLTLTLEDNQADIHVNYEPAEANYGKEIFWSVDDPSILDLAASGSFNENLSITAKACGIATITAQTADGHEANCIVTVRDIVYASSVEELQSAHYPYEKNIDRTWIYTDETKDFMILTFDEESYLSYGDMLEVMDGNGNTVISGTGSDFSGRTFMVNDSTVQIRLQSGEYTDGYYGFRVTEITDVIDSQDIYVEAYDQEYTGKAIAPEFYVCFHSMYLMKDVDYTLMFSNNKNIGTATVQFIGKGMFDGITTETTFRILPSYSKLDTTIVKDGIKLSWTASKGAGGYRLYRSVDGGAMELYKTLSGSSKTFTDKDTSGEHYYHYMLVPYKNVKKGKETICYEGYSDSYGPITKLGPVTNLTAVTDQTQNSSSVPYQVTLEWNALEGAEGYIIYRCDNSDYFYEYSSTSDTRYTTTVYNSGKTQFKVLPYKYNDYIQYEGAASNAVSVYGMYSPYLSSYQTQKGVRLNYEFEYIEGKTGIELYRSTNGGKFTKFKTVKTTDRYTYGELTDTSAKKSGTYYEYKARTYVTDGKKTYYSPFSNVTSIMYLSAPSITSVKSAETGLNVTWQKVAGADYYMIHRYYYDGYDYSTDDTFTFAVTDQTEKTHTFLDESAVAPGMYQYTIQACAEKNGQISYSMYSNYKMGYVLRTPELNYLNNSQKGVELGWDWPALTRGFEVWRSADGGNQWKKVKSLSSTYLNDTGANKNGITYAYKIRAYASANGVTYYSGFSNELSITKMTPPMPQKTVVLADGGFEITFTAVADAQGYRIVRYAEDRPNEILPDIQQTGSKTYTFSDPGAIEENVLYSYEITAYREKNGTYSQASCYLFAYNFGQPEVTVENAEKGIMIYASVTGESGSSHADTYTVYRSENGGKWKKLKTVSADNYGRLAYRDKTAKTGKTYSYKVEGFNKNLAVYTVQQSEPVSILCAPGPKQGKPVNSIVGITVSWAAQKNMPEAACYQIYRSRDGYSFEWIDTVDSQTYTYTDTGAVSVYDGYYDENMYYYKVAAIPADENAPVTFSDIQKIYRLDAPYNLYVYNSGLKTADVYWDYNGYANGFEVRYVSGKTTKIIDAKYYWDYYPLTGLSTGKTYEVSVRSYLKLANVKYYSDWSDPVTLYK